MMHPNEKLNKRALGAIRDEVATKSEDNEGSFYNQRIDIDTYLCD